MREGIDCKGRKWVERELKRTAKILLDRLVKTLLLFCQFIMKTKQVGYVNVNVAMRLLQLYLNGAM